VDQIFDRLERLVRAWTSSAFREGFGRNNFGSSDTFEDQDLADAWQELESYLDPSKTESEREAEMRRRSEFRSQASNDQDPRKAMERQAVQDAYRFLGLEPYAPFAEVKARYKELLKKHHPDRHTASPEDMKTATAVSAKINAAYQLIETWEEARAQKAR